MEAEESLVIYLLVRDHGAAFELNEPKTCLRTQITRIIPAIQYAHEGTKLQPLGKAV